MSKPQNPVSGLLNIDKPRGATSHDVVARVRRLSRQRKAGHTGTLDPMATGVLLVCLGQATRLIEYLGQSRKQYLATIRFGLTTDTFDIEGNVVSQSDPSTLTEARLREILPAFMGEIEQIPPIFSALKKDGQPLYKLARTGVQLDPAPRPVTIYNLVWRDWRPPDLTLEIGCSGGTYIRSLARDIGQAAGPGATLVALTRTFNAGWSLEQAVPLETLEREAQANQAGWQKYLYAIDRVVAHLPRITLDEMATRHVQHGRPIKITPSEIEPGDTDQAVATPLRAYAPGGAFLAILEAAGPEENMWQPKKVFQTG
jgi:tRNA pseudouridine55 synthase